MSLTERETAWLLAMAEMMPAYDEATMKKPYVKLGGDNPDYIWQDGHIYAWSESNTAYQICWWLTPDGKPVAVGNEPSAHHIANLLVSRPWDQDWLKQVVPPG